MYTIGHTAHLRVGLGGGSSVYFFACSSNVALKDSNQIISLHTCMVWSKYTAATVSRRGNERTALLSRQQPLAKLGRQVIEGLVGVGEGRERHHALEALLEGGAETH